MKKKKYKSQCDSAFPLHDFHAHFFQCTFGIALRKRFDSVNGLVGKILRQRSRLLDAVARLNYLAGLFGSVSAKDQ